MRILHLDQNHEYLSSELEKLGFENHYDYTSSKDEILEKIDDYATHSILILSIFDVRLNSENPDPLLYCNGSYSKL